MTFVQESHKWWQYFYSIGTTLRGRANVRGNRPAVAGPVDRGVRRPWYCDDTGSAGRQAHVHFSGLFEVGVGASAADQPMEHDIGEDNRRGNTLSAGHALNDCLDGVEGYK